MDFFGVPIKPSYVREVKTKYKLTQRIPIPMKRIYLMMALLWALAGAATAQKYTLSGTVADGLGESLPGAAAALLNAKDSTLLAGAATDMQGQFRLTAPKAGTYLLRLSYMGYVTQYRSVTFSRSQNTLALGTLTLAEDAKVMQEAQVTAKLAQVEMKEDTFVYNADAYRLPEGAALEELVRKLPGAEVADDGTITINGKTVKKIMVDGKNFFEGDTKMAMKNLPSKMVKRIKAYDRQSDYSRVTGIDDGEEETVLDLDVQKGMKEGWVINADVAGGTEDRYSLKGNVMRFADRFKFALIGSRNNVNDAGFPGGGGRFRGGGGGITTSNMAGLNISWENGRKEDDAGYLKLGGNVRYSSTKTTTDSRSNSETFLTASTSTFSNARNHSVTHATNVNANLRLEWKPDSATTINLKPNFSHSESDNFGLSSSVTFNSDPYAAGLTNPLDEYAAWADPDSIRVNANTRYAYGDSRSNSGDVDLQVNRKLGRAGRNVTLNLGGQYSRSQSNSYSRSLVQYYLRDSRTATYQNTFSPSENYRYQARLSYSEPIFKGANLQFTYQVQRRYQDQNRSIYTYADLADQLESMGITNYTAEDLYTGNIAGLNSLVLAQDLHNSQYATYKELNHDATALLRYRVGDLRINAGVSFQPQTTHMDYAKSNIDTTITRRTRNWSPRVDVRWKISDASQLRVRYNGWMGQPSMTNLIEVTDSSDPLNISIGNAGLESSWTDRFFAFYNGYNAGKQRGWAANFNGNIQRRSISSATIYDTETGVKYRRPMNIDGRWGVGGMVMFNTALGERKLFNFSTHTNVNYNNDVDYISSDLTAASRSYLTSGTGGGVDLNGLFRSMALAKATTKTTSLNETLRLNFRNELGANDDYSLDLGLATSVNYQHARNKVQTNANLDTWTYSYGGNVTFTTPFNLSFSSDLTQQSRRGYEDKSMNTDELIWNAQLSQGLKQWFKGHDLTVSVQWYDILNQRSSISRSISATMRSDTWTNAINSYVMVHLIYKFNLMGNKQAREAMGPGGFDGFGGPGSGRGGRGGGPGGFGGRPF